MGNPDPYLAYQPAYAFTLPIQLLVTGITLTLLVVLLIHLLFTTQYHYPLAPLNYCLQLSSIISVLLSVGVTIGTILTHTNTQADHWPYALDYVSVPVPANKWTHAEDALWLTLQALCNGLANLTHIQFLTLLYPSRSEARLIFIALGPLAIASSGLYYCTLSKNPAVVGMGEAIRSVFSCTLLVIFTLSLCIWGFLVNRNRAWRFDGGTAVFGMGALGLAVVTTASSFVAVKEERIDWLQPLIWACVLWQTWLGWWWWVGAGMGIGEVEDLIEKSMRKRRQAARRAHRRDVIQSTGNGNPQARRQTSMAGMVKTSTSAVVGFTSSLATNMRQAGSAPGSRGGSAHADEALHSSVRARRPQSAPPRDVEEGITEDIELGTLRVREPVRDEHHGSNGSGGSGSQGRHPQSSNSNSETSSTSRTPSLHAPRSVAQFVAFPATWLQVYLRRLRRAHEEAINRRAVEQAERRARVPTITGPAVADDGWGLSHFSVREHHESSRRIHEADRALRRSSDDGDDDENLEDDKGQGGEPREGSGTTAVESPSASLERRESQNQHTDEEWEDVGTDSGDDDPTAQPAGSRASTPRPEQPAPPGSSWSWWGPLREWRLEDRSRY